MSKNAPKRKTNGLGATHARDAVRAQGKPPLMWSGVLFALAANVLGVNALAWLLGALQTNLQVTLVVVLLSSLFIGAATALYSRQRAGMHAFLGGLLSIPVLALTAFGGQWQSAIICGALCGMGGVLAEVLLRGRAARQ